MPKTNLIPIRVKIKLGVIGGTRRHIFPDFNQISSAIRQNMDWSVYFDFMGLGWHYDQISDFGKVDAYNPDPDMWYGATCVPKDFAEAAVLLFPNEVEVIDEVAFEDFYDNRAHVNEPPQKINTEVLQQIQVHRDLGLPDEPWMTKALDPNDPTAGITINTSRYWELVKAQSGLTIDDTQSKKI